MAALEKYEVRVIDREHIEAVNVKQNVQIGDFFQKAVEGNYKYYRAVGEGKLVEVGKPHERKLYSWNEAQKKGLYAGSTVEKQPDLWFENPHYVAPGESKPEPISAKPVAQQAKTVQETVNYDTVEKHIRRLKEQNDDLLASVSKLTEELKVSNLENAEQATEISKLLDEKATLEGQIENLKAVISKFESEALAVKDDLTTYRELCSARDTLASFVNKKGSK